MLLCHIHIAALGKISSLAVTFRVRIRFRMLQECSPEARDWEKVMSKSMFYIITTIGKACCSTTKLSVGQDALLYDGTGNTYLLPL